MRSGRRPSRDPHDPLIDEMRVAAMLPSDTCTPGEWPPIMPRSAWSHAAPRLGTLALACGIYWLTKYALAEVVAALVALAVFGWFVVVSWARTSCPPSPTSPTHQPPQNFGETYQP